MAWKCDAHARKVPEPWGARIFLGYWIDQRPLLEGWYEGPAYRARRAVPEGVVASGAGLLADEAGQLPGLGEAQRTEVNDS